MKDKYLKYKQLSEISRKREIDDINAFLSIEREINVILDTFRSGSTNTLVTYEQLSTMIFDTWFDLGNGVKFMRVFHPEKPVHYITEMDPKLSETNVAEFGMQEHNCKELCTVLEGELIEPVEMCKRYVKDEVVVYPANFLHRPKATVFSRYSVEFLDPSVE